MAEIGEPVDDYFGEKLKEARQSADMTQGDVARLMRLQGFDFHQQTLYKIERGDRKVSIGEAVALAEILRVPLATLTRRYELPVEVFRTAGREYYSKLVDIYEAVDDAVALRERFRRSVPKDLDIEGTVAVEFPTGEVVNVNVDPEGMRQIFDGLLYFPGLHEFTHSWKEWLAGPRPALGLTFLGVPEQGEDGSQSNPFLNEILASIERRHGDKEEHPEAP